MKIGNCSTDNLDACFQYYNIVFFGMGSWMEIVRFTPLMKYKEHFKYIIDNNTTYSERFIGSVRLSVFKPERIKCEQKCIVIITSPVYMYDMYMQLQDYDLSDDILVYFLPFMGMNNQCSTSGELLKEIRNIDGVPQIPKIIHSFWFSNERKSYDYQKCIDTWDKLTGYKIIEWNKANYEYERHPFLKRAIELEAWAYASDYARLDVVNTYGGFYMDMDVEVFKPFDDLLCNEAIFAFSNSFWIDLAVFASKKDNPIVGELLKIYDGLPLPECKEDFKKYFQPALICETLAQYGIKMNGTLQNIKNATIVPQEFFFPMDGVVFAPYERTDNTYTVHYNNFGWSTGSINNKHKKKQGNRILMELISE